VLCLSDGDSFGLAEFPFLSDESNASDEPIVDSALTASPKNEQLLSHCRLNSSWPFSAGIDTRFCEQQRLQIT
jgi:hypothetical protein